MSTEEIKGGKFSALHDRLKMGKNHSKSHKTKKTKDDYCVNNNISTSPSSLTADSNNFVQTVHTNNPANAREPPPQNHELIELEDKLEYEVLTLLIGHDFTSAFRAIKHNPTKQSSSDRKYVLELLHSLKREIVAFSPGEMNMLRKELDVKTEGVTAFMKAVDNVKIAIFAFDYHSIDRAKHLLNVKCGRVVTMKCNDSGDNREQVTHFCSKSSSLANQNYITKSGINISVYKADITQLKVDAIVNAANERLAHIGGVALAIARVAGLGLQIEGDEYIKTHGSLKVTDVVPTSSGNLPCKKVLHAVGPRWKDYPDKNLCQQHLAQTVFNCFLLAHKLHVTSLAMSSISSATFGVPPDICATMYLAAIQRFDYKYGPITALQHIHFVDISDEMVTIIQDTFTKQLTRRDCSHPSGNRQLEGAPQTGNTQYGYNYSDPQPRILPSGHTKSYYPPREVDQTYGPNKAKNSQTRDKYDRSRYTSSDEGYIHDRSRYIPSDEGYKHDRSRYAPSDEGYKHDRSRYTASDEGYIHDRSRYTPSDEGYKHDRSRYSPSDEGYKHDRSRYAPSDEGYIHDRSRYAPSDEGYKHDRSRYAPSDEGYKHDRSRYTPSDEGYIHDRSRYTPSDEGYIHDRSRYTSSDVGYIHDRSRYTPSDVGYKREQYYSTNSLDKR